MAYTSSRLADTPSTSRYKPVPVESNASASNDLHFTRKTDLGSTSMPTRPVTAPTSSSAPLERQAGFWSRRTITAYIQSKIDPHAMTVQIPDLHSFPESDLDIKPLSNQATFDTVGSGSFEETQAWDQKSILSLGTYGGGIRRYSSLLIVQALMKAIASEEQDPRLRGAGEYVGSAESSLFPVTHPSNLARETERLGPDASILTDSTKSAWLPCHYFDYIAGTSTGGLISIMLGRLRMNIDDCINEYEKLGAKVFGNPRWFHVQSPLFFPREKLNHKVLKSVIEDLVSRRVPKINKFPGGETFAIADGRRRVAVISYQQSEDADEVPYIFRTYQNICPGCTDEERSSARNPGPAHDLPIWQVARATSAAPLYFKEISIKGSRYLDGGFGTNNPWMEIIEEVRRMNNLNDDCLQNVISIGTGVKRQRHIPKSSVGLGKFSDLFHFATQLVTESEVTHEKVIEKQSTLGYRFKYDRLNVDGLEDIKLDEWKTRGPLKVWIGKFVQSKSHKGDQCKVNGHPLTDKNASAANETAHFGDDEANQKARKEAKNVGIPSQFQDCNETLDRIRERTGNYLKKEEVKSQIADCAVRLVRSRRRRVQADGKRWHRACYGTWYQCRLRGCPKGEVEYHDRKMIESHLRTKHRHVFTGTFEAREKELDEKIAAFQVIRE